METTTATRAVDLGQAIAGKASGTLIQVPANLTPEARAYIPAIDPAYRFHGGHSLLLGWIGACSDMPLYITGPAGSGKTSGAKQLAARLGLPVYEITAHESLAAIDLQGHMAIRQGETVWEDGPLTLAMKNGGIFLINELDAASPSCTIALNSILDGSPLCLEATGEIIRPHPAFHFIATGNTAGSGDATGTYAGTQIQSAALMDRLLVIEQGYPTRQVEEAILAPHMPDQSARKAMLDLAEGTRKAASDEDMTSAISTRALVQWARASRIFRKLPILEALSKSLPMAVTAKRDPAEAVAILELWQRVSGM